MMKRTAFILSFILGLLCASQGQVMMIFTSDSLMNITSPLAVDSLFYWFAADQGVTDSLGGAIATDEGVGTWTDLSGGGRNVTSAGGDTKRPVYKSTGGPGNRPCIQFDGSNDYLASSTHFWGSDDLTIIVVNKFADATRAAIEVVVGKWEGSNLQWILLGRSSTSPSYSMRNSFSADGSAQFAQDAGANAKHSNWKCHVLTYNGSSTFGWYTDGATVTTSTIGTPSTIFNATKNLAIGCNDSGGTPASFLQGSISEIIVYTKALTAAERGAIETYLNKKYDLY